MRLRPTSMRWLACAMLGLFAAPAFASVSVAEPAPEFSLPSTTGRRISLAGQRGKVVLVDFWAEWCQPCRHELPELERIARDYAKRGVVVLSINIDKDRAHAVRMAHELGITFPVLLDPSGRVAATYDLPKMPTSFVLDPKGMVRFVHEGFDGARDVAKFRRELDQLLARHP